MARKLPSATPAPPAPAVGTAWLDAVEAGSRAWMTAFTGFAEACVAASQAQAQAAGQLMSLWTRGLPTAPGLPSVDQLLREQLMFAEGQAERTAEAARQTLQDLQALESASGKAQAPVPLPE